MHEARGARASSAISEQALNRTSGAVLRPGNRLTLLRNGDATYESWLAGIEAATRWVHLDNYIFKDDATGQRFAKALAERARAGVMVRVLYDWYGSLDVRHTLWPQLRAAGVDVRAINPPRPADPLAMLSRDHRKLLAVDGTYGSVGGIGIADPWLERDPRSGLPYRDTAVAVVGPAVADIEAAFAGVWDLNGAPLPAAERPRPGVIAPAGETPVRVVIQEPGKLRLSRSLQVMAAAVEDRFWIADPYFLADPILREALIAAAADGVDVRLLLPSTNDLPIVGALSRASYRPLLEAGVRIWEYRGPMMHAKTSVADGWCARIGSTNLNVTGLMTNWEIDVIAQDQAFGRLMEEMFLADLDDAEELVLPLRRGARRRSMRGLGALARGSGAQVPSTVASLSGALAQGALSDVLARNERNLHLLFGGGALLLALGFARVPRLLTWPVTAVLGAFGAYRLGRAFGIGWRNRWGRARGVPAEAEPRSRVQG